MGLVLHVINHTAQSRSIRLIPADHEDLTGEVFLSLVKDDFAILRRFRGESSLATYLTVVARRVVVHQLMARKTTALLDDNAAHQESQEDRVLDRISNREEVDRLLARLGGTEAAVVRLYHLEGKSYQEISSVVGMPQNSVGPMLSRARGKMRHTGADRVS